jgi:hypothetical protein
VTLVPGQEGEVAAWLRRLGLERYATAFLNAEITPEALPELTVADLRELGLPLRPCRLVLRAIYASTGSPAAPVGLLYRGGRRMTEQRRWR